MFAKRIDMLPFVWYGLLSKRKNGKHLTIGGYLKTYEELMHEIHACADANFIVPTSRPWGVMVLSAPPEKWGEDLVSEITTENVERIKTAIDFFRDHPEWKDDLPYLILNGETNQLPMMLEIATAYYFPVDRILLVDCGRRPKGNTQTQFTVLRKDSRFAGKTKRIIAVTSWYHVPRVARTIAANSQKNLSWNLLALPAGKSRLAILPRTIEGEAARILDYVKNGTLAAEPILYFAA